jgi:hypothetical protein
MELNKEYVIIVTNDGSMNRIFFDNRYLSLRMGWNLIANPVNSQINIKEKFVNNTLSYKYDSNSSWIKNPTTLNQGEGLWILYEENHANILFTEFNTSDEYKIDFNKTSSGWNLLGTGSDTNMAEIAHSSLWAFDYFDKIWIKEPSKIYRGYGFWIKR